MMCHFAKCLPCGVCFSLLLLLLFFTPVHCPAADTLLAGVAVRDITPKDPVWLSGYAREVPCYIPSKRILLEGGYEADSSLIDYGIYGPFKPQVEDILVAKVKEMVAGTKKK